MMGRLSTHVLDVANGRPAHGLRIELSRIVDGVAEVLTTVTTNAEGRTDKPLLAGEALVAGKYRLQFHVADYFQSVGMADAGKFLDLVPVEFIVEDGRAG